jgi:hypothetical protein
VIESTNAWTKRETTLMLDWMLKLTELEKIGAMLWQTD